MYYYIVKDTIYTQELAIINPCELKGKNEMEEKLLNLIVDDHGDTTWEYSYPIKVLI